jgi:PAS domain S-box-containing protein
MGLVALFSLRFGLRVVTSSLQNLANEAMHIAQGQLDRPLQMNGVDEIGQLRRSFEQMRVSLQARLEELNRLLLVSQGVASSLEMQDAVHPVLEAALATGASAVRVVLAAAPEEDMPTRFALGPLREAYAHLDEQILNRTQHQEILVLSHLSRGQLLKLDPGKPAPASILAVGLRHENQFYGVLWAAYDTLHIFSDADVRFISTLAGQAALAAANNYLYLTAQIGRQRLASILASTPDPVLVTDQQDRLLLANPAARLALGFDASDKEGQPIQAVIQQKSLLDVLLTDSSDKQSAEVALANGQTYFATASPVMADGRLVGRVCILRDVTHFKELDRMKSEFVNTVSHDLRSPLTLIRGYATMLETVGALNEQQKSYSGKIVVGVENMARLVNNLLDLGRIEAGVGLMLETVSLMEIFERITSPLQMLAAHKQIRLSAEPSLQPGTVIEADQALLQQAMYNLVENAIKYTPAGGSVTARIRLLDPRTMRFEVQDTGIGITEADKARLYEKFFRGSQREARAEKGSGLGLAIVRSIIERHGGKIWFESEAGKGTTFFVEIPLAQPKE